MLGLLLILLLFLGLIGGLLLLVLFLLLLRLLLIRGFLLLVLPRLLLLVLLFLLLLFLLVLVLLLILLLLLFLLLFLLQERGHSVEQRVIGISSQPVEDLSLSLPIFLPNVRLRAAMEVILRRLSAQPKRNKAKAKACQSLEHLSLLSVFQ